MHEDKSSNESALEMRLKQITRYVTLGLLGVLALCALLFMYVGSVKQNEKAAIGQSQAQAQTAVQSDLCQVYPATDVCRMSREILANPQATIVPKDGKDGQDGKNGQDGKDGKDGAEGRGITKFDKASGNLIVTFTDGQTQDLGRIVGDIGATGAAGKDGEDGADGRGIVSSDISSGSLIITYTDGTTQNAGFVVGPKGDTGATGATGAPGADGRDGIDGKDGAPGKNGLTPTGVNSDAAGNVTVTYSDGSSALAGQIILPRIEIFRCESDTLTLKLTNGPAFSTAADCTPDNFPNVPGVPTK